MLVDDLVVRESTFRRRHSLRESIDGIVVQTTKIKWYQLILKEKMVCGRISRIEIQLWTTLCEGELVLSIF